MKVVSQCKGSLQIVMLEGAGHAGDFDRADADRLGGVAPSCGDRGDFFDDHAGLRQSEREIPRCGL